MSIKRKRFSDEILKRDNLATYYSPQTHLKQNNTERLKIKGGKRAFQKNTNQKKATVTMLISKNENLRKAVFKRVKRGISKNNNYELACTKKYSLKI